MPSIKSRPFAPKLLMLTWLVGCSGERAETAPSIEGQDAGAPTRVGAVSTNETKSDSSEELEAAIEMMRAQGVPEAQIEEFQRMAKTLSVYEAPESQRRHQENRARERADVEFESIYRDEPEVLVSIGDENYELTRTLCRADLDNFAILASSGDDKESAVFRLRHNSTHLGTHNTELYFEHGDVYLSVEPAPWQYENGYYTFSGEVTVFTLYGDTAGRGQTKETRVMTVRAPCQ